MDALALILSVAAMFMFVFAASGRELRRFNEIALGLVFLTAALICQFTSITNTHIGRLQLPKSAERPGEQVAIPAVDRSGGKGDGWLHSSGGAESGNIM
jgi:hypothetical protein